MRFTNVWVKRGGKWQIVAEHSSVVQPPINWRGNKRQSKAEEVLRNEQ